MAKKPQSPSSESPRIDTSAGQRRPTVVPLEHTPAGRDQPTVVSLDAPASRAGRSQGKFVVPPEFHEAKKKLLEQFGGLGACIQARLAGGVENDPDAVGLANIQGVCIGPETRDGSYTGRLAVKVLVRRKVTDQRRIVDAAAKVPPFIKVGNKEIPTDVEEIGPVAAHIGKIGAPENPARPGTSISPEGKPTGTFGCLVAVRFGDAGENKVIICILSNAHVLALDDTGAPLGPKRKDGSDGVSIVQPGAADAASGKFVGQLYDYSELSLSQSNNTKLVRSSFVDAAVAWTNFGHVSPSHHSYEMEAEPILDEDDPDLHGSFVQVPVMKEGRTTGQTFGIIRDAHADMVVGYGEKPAGSAPFAHFTNLLLIKGQGGDAFSEPGDSGSLVVHASTHRPLGLLLAGDGITTFANPIGDVMQALNIRTFITSKNQGDFGG